MNDDPAGEKRRRRSSVSRRRRQILDAALVVFLAEGYTAARMDDVAARAGVAKGTIYLHFTDKEELFRSLIQEEIGPVVAGTEAMVGVFGGSTRDLLKRLATGLQKEVLETHRADILRLVLSEAPRFPWLAEFYWQEVVSKGIGVIRAVAARAVARGEFSSDALVRFPQLIVAPMLVAVIWKALFERFEPLEAGAMIETYLDLLLRGLE
ncbi:TetR/AcrR family transcriptional regulator [Chelatococcus sp. GCM10030263]|uniref:TetR/AcrR family transcriptional regulator n=1 Tax=Chelatococcus sp. GCM10030263 TaxID=3273387 RepID=UPI00361C4CA3